MIDKINKNDNFENQQIFHDIEQTKRYSNYSIELNQTFGDKSYEKFYKSLMEHKRARGLNFFSMFQKPKNSSGLKVYEEPFNITEFKSALKTMKKKNDLVNYRIKNPYTIRPKYKSITKTRIENEKKNSKKTQKTNKSMETSYIYLPEVPEVGRYNPTYGVLDKHTYQVAFSQKNYEDFNKEGLGHKTRNIFNDHSKTDYNYNDKPMSFDKKKKFLKSKIKPISIEMISNMSKTYNKNEKNQKNQSEIMKRISNRFNTSSLFNSINSQLNTNSNSNQNISSNIGLNKSNSNNNNVQLTDSQILIRTNGDIHSRCPKHLSNTYFNSNASLSFDESAIFTDSFNNSNSNINPNSKNNHCLKFETYTKRKPMIRKFNYENEDFTNTEAYKTIFPAKDRNICIEFDKLSTAKDKQKCFFEVEASKNKNPPLGTYFPKFGLNFKKLVDVYIDKKSPPITNKTRLKEIILKYNVPSNYLLFNALNKK